MRNYGRFLKNIAALCMLAALLSLLLPFCEVTNGSSKKADVTTISGMDMVIAGGKLTVQYLREGEISEDYAVKGELTWGDIRQAVTAANDAAGTEILVGTCVALAVPVVCCILALLGTMIAAKKKGMILPVLFLIIAILENAFLIKRFSDLVDIAKGYATKGVVLPKITLLIGIYAFTILCAVALVIILFAWLIRGFEDPEKDDRRGNRADSRDSKDRHHRKHHKKRKSKKSRKKDKTKKDKDKKEDKEKDTKKDTNESEPENELPAEGKVTGISGIYSDVVTDLTKNGSCIIGTTPEAMAAVASNHISSLNSLADKSCVIRYDAATRRYTVTSHSLSPIVVQTNANMTSLQKGESIVAGKDTILRIGNGDKSSICLH